MIDSRNQFSPRFVHMHNYGTPGTIAYVRDNSHVFFAWSKLSPSDVYVKSIGREISATRLELALPQLLVLAEIGHTGVFHEFNYGFISAADLVSNDTSISMILADHQLALLTPMDFKHSHITHFLVGKVCY